MSMLGANDLCRAILEDADVATAFDLDSDGERDLMSSFLRDSGSTMRIISIHGHTASPSASAAISTLGLGAFTLP